MQNKYLGMSKALTYRLADFIFNYYTRMFSQFLHGSLQVDTLLRQNINAVSLPSLSAIVILNDTILWTGNFGKRNSSDLHSGPPNEYTIYR